MRASDHVCRLLALSDAACLGMRVTRTSASSASATRFNVRKLAVLPPSRRAMTGCCIPARLASCRCDKSRSMRRSINCRIKAYSSSSASYPVCTLGFFKCFFSDSRHGTPGRQVRPLFFGSLIRSSFTPVASTNTIALLLSLVNPVEHVSALQSRPTSIFVLREHAECYTARHDIFVPRPPRRLGAGHVVNGG